MKRVIIIVTLIGVAGLWVLGPERDHAAPAGWSLGIERAYALELATHAQLPADGALGDDGTLVDLRMRGRLAMTVIATGPALVVRAHYVGDTLSLAGGSTGSQPDPASVRAALGQPFYLTYGTTGALVGIRTAPDTAPFVIGVFRALGTAVRLTAPTAHRDDWEVTEEDAAGAYVARYRVLDRSAASATRVRKDKQRYLNEATSVIASQHELAFEDAGALGGVRSHETLRTVGGPLPNLEVRTELTLAYLAMTDRRLELGLLRSHYRAWPELLARDAGFGSARDRAALTGWQYADILATLRAHALAKQAATPSKADKERAARAYAALTALLRLHPHQLASVRMQIVEDGPLANTMIAALRDAGTPDAQRVLRELLAEPRAVARRPRLARGLSLVDHPTQATVETLESLQTDAQLGVQATYGLGATLFHLRERDPALAARVLARLLDQLARAETRFRKVELLIALGNAGHPDTIGWVAPYLRDADENVRAAAARALRRIPTPRADDLLAHVVGDPSAVVRAAVIDALDQRSPTIVLATALATRLVDEPEFSVRARTVHLAASWLVHARTTLLGPLTRVAEHDESPDLRRIAQAALK